MADPRPDRLNYVHHSTAMAPMAQNPENLTLAVQLFRAGRLPEAEQACVQADQEAPHHPLISMLLGTIRMALGDAEGAVEPFRTAVQLRPADTEAKTGLFRAQAHAHLRAGELQAAGAGLRGLLILNPDDRDAQLRLAGIRSQLGGEGRSRTLNGRFG